MYSIHPKRNEKNAWINGADKKLNARYKTVLRLFNFNTTGGSIRVHNIGMG